MLKDEHLLDAALWTDKRVLSMDHEVHKDFIKLSDTVERIRSIIWLNPEKQCDECFVWLKSGAPEDSIYYIGK